MKNAENEIRRRAADDSAARFLLRFFAEQLKQHAVALCQLHGGQGKAAGAHETQRCRAKKQGQQLFKAQITAVALAVQQESAAIEGECILAIARGQFCA